MTSNALFPTRLTEEEILANPAYTAYVILNIPTHGQNVPFDTIGRTTFKKFIIKSYTDFYDNGSLKTSNFKSVPFIISETPTVARVVYVSNNRQPLETNANKKKKLAPQNQNQSQIKQVHPPPKATPLQVQQLPTTQVQPKIQPVVPVKNIVEPALTIEMGDGTDGEYYAPSHCK